MCRTTLHLIITTKPIKTKINNNITSQSSGLEKDSALIISLCPCPQCSHPGLLVIIIIIMRSPQSPGRPIEMTRVGRPLWTLLEDV